MIAFDKLRSQGAALKELGVANRQETGHGKNRRAGNSHLLFRRRERAILRFQRMRGVYTFGAVQAFVANRFN